MITLPTQQIFVISAFAVNPKFAKMLERGRIAHGIAILPGDTRPFLEIARELLQNPQNLAAAEASRARYNLDIEPDWIDRWITFTGLDSVDASDLVKTHG